MLELLHMKIAVLGTGMVGRAHAGRLLQLGHEVVVGTKNVEKTLSETKPDSMGNPPFSKWQEFHTTIKLDTFENASKGADIVFEALHGQVAVNVLKSIEGALAGKILIDISNPLDFSKGMPPVLFVSNTDSLGEQIQRALPKTKVVKTLNTLNADLQVNPSQLANGDHDIFVSGNDKEAKSKVIEILKSYGWKNILDLGDITTARGTEMLMAFWLRAWQALGSPMFNYKIVEG